MNAQNDEIAARSIFAGNYIYIYIVIMEQIEHMEIQRTHQNRNPLEIPCCIVHVLSTSGWLYNMPLGS